MNAGRRVNKLHVYAEPIVAPLNTSFDNVANTEVTSDLFHVDVLALVREGRVPCNDRRAGYWHKSVVRLSVTPSTKYSCSGSPPILAKGSTTSESRGGSRRLEADGGFAEGGAASDASTFAAATTSGDSA